MFDFDLGAWQPERDTVAEVVHTPASSAGGHYRVQPGERALLRRAGHAAAMRLDAEGAGMLAQPGDRSLWWYERPITCRFRQISVGDTLLSFAAVLAIDAPERFVAWLETTSQQRVTPDVLAAELSTDERIRTALAREARRPSDDGIAAALSELLPATLGLRLVDVEDARTGAPFDPAEMLAPGATVGRGWRLRRRLGSGYFGEVWLADHPTMPGIEEALKFVPKPDYAQLARREALKLIDLCKDPAFDFRHVVRLTDVFTGVPFLIAYEYLAGDSLSAYVQGARGGRLSASRAVEIGGHILEGLAQIHDAGYVHYDLHPGNVMILARPAGLQAKIVDFGLAWRLAVGRRAADAATDLGDARPFAKSEPRDPRKGELPDARTDLYSVGLLLWLMVTGAWGLPEGGALEDAWPHNRALLSIIRQACLVKRDDRYASARDMARDLARVTAWRPPTAPPLGARTVEPGEGTLAHEVRDAPAGSTLHLRAGRHTLAGTLVLDKSITLVGDGMDRTWVLWAGEGTGVVCAGPAMTILRDIAFESLGSRPGHVVEVSGGAFEIARCRFEGGAYDPETQRGGGGLRIAGDATGAVTGCEASRNARAGILVEDGAKPTLLGNNCRDNLGSGIAYHGRAAGTARGDLCVRNGAHGIDVRDRAAPLIEGNRCERNAGSGIAFGQSAGGAAVANECLDQDQDGIQAAGEASPRLEQNRCERNRWSGIAYTDRATGSASGNVCTDNDQHGVYVAGESRPSLERNVCELNGLSGISCAGFVRPQLAGNTCSNNAGHGILIGDQASPAIHANRCERNGSDGIAYRDQGGGAAAENVARTNIGHDLSVAATARPSLGRNELAGGDAGLLDLRREAPDRPPAADNRAVLAWLFETGRIGLEQHPFLSTSPGDLEAGLRWDRVEGMLLGLAIGDSLGNTTEGLAPEERRARYGAIVHYVGTNPTTGEKAGYPSGDTELAFLTVEHLLEEGRLEPSLLSRRLASRPVLRAGPAYQEFARNVAGGKAWFEAGPYRGGDGALMRIAPVLLPHLRRPSPALWADAALAAMLTHNDRGSTAACIAFVRLLWLLLQMDRPPDDSWWVDTFCWTAAALEGDTMYPSRTSPYDRRPDARLAYRGSMGRYAQASVERARDAGWPVTRACREWVGGSYLLEAVPCLLYILLNHADDPEQAMIRAVNDTADNNTVAALVGAALGALHGKDAFPWRWRDGLLGRAARHGPDGQIYQLIDRARVAFSPSRAPI